jgi:hypothetical protein
MNKCRACDAPVRLPGLCGPCAAYECGRQAGLEEAAKVFARLADAYHFAGALKDERLVRDHIRALKGKS